MIRDILGDRSTKELMEDIAILILNSKKLAWQNLRPWKEFFSVFKLPQANIRHMEQRIATNFLHYRSNYFLISIVILSFQILLVPVLLLSLILVLSIFGYFFFIQKKAIKLGQIIINNTGKSLICTFISILLLAETKTLEHLIWCFMYCVIICTIHMIFRPRSVTAKTDKLYEELKMNGFNWYNGQAPIKKANVSEVVTDPENPAQHEELTFSAANPLSANAAVRKRAPGVAMNTNPISKHQNNVISGKRD